MAREPIHRHNQATVRRRRPHCLQARNGWHRKDRWFQSGR